MMNDPKTNDQDPLGYVHDMLALGRKCQLVPENDFILQRIAGEMTDTVRAVYQGADIAFAFLERGRRHVIASVLAKVGAPSTPEQAQRFLSMFLSSKNDALIRWAYGDCPKGFVPLLRKLDDQLLAPGLYGQVHDFICRHPDAIGPILCAAPTCGLDREQVELILHLPPMGERLVKLWTKFDSVHAYDRFLEAYRAVTGLAEVAPPHLDRIANGEEPSKLVEDLYLDAPFPPPAICGVRNISHIPNGRQLRTVSKAFRNCLTSFTEAALQGQKQFYVATLDPKTKVVFAIENDHPFAFRLFDIKGPRNADPDEAAVTGLKATLATLGIHDRPDTESLLRRLRRPSRLPREMEMELFGFADL